MNTDAPALPDANDAYGFETGMGNYYSYPTPEARMSAAVDLAVEFALDNAAIEGIDNAREISPEIFTFVDHGEDVGPVRMEKEPLYWQRLEERLEASLENPEQTLTDEGYKARRVTKHEAIYEKADETDPRIASHLAVSHDMGGLFVQVTPVLVQDMGAPIPLDKVEPGLVHYDPDRLAEFASPRAALAEALRESFVLADQLREPVRAWVAEQDREMTSPDREFKVRYAGAKERFGGQHHSATAEAHVAGKVVEQMSFTGTSKEGVVLHTQKVCQVAANEGRTLKQAAVELAQRQEREGKGYAQEPSR